MHYLYEYGTPGLQLFITFLDGQKIGMEQKKTQTHAYKHNCQRSRWEGDESVRERNASNKIRPPKNDKIWPIS